MRVIERADQRLEAVELVHVVHPVPDGELMEGRERDRPQSLWPVRNQLPKRDPEKLKVGWDKRTVPPSGDAVLFLGLASPVQLATEGVRFVAPRQMPAQGSDQFFWSASNVSWPC